MTADHDDDRWVAHRREGWTVESPERREPVSVHDDFDDARAALHDDIDGGDDHEREWPHGPDAGLTQRLRARLLPTRADGYGTGIAAAAHDLGGRSLAQQREKTPASEERWSGYVVDIACLRKYPASEYAIRASEHSTECALMGHCIESGYGLVDDNGTIHLVDSHATAEVVDALTSTDQGHGLRLIVDRHMQDGEMVTTSIREATAGGG